IYVIDFFASWCGSCKKEIPLISLANQKIDKTKVEIIGIDVDKKLKDGEKFQNRLKSKNQLNFRVINDPQGNIISKFAPIGMPTLYYVKNKKVLKIIVSAVDEIDKKILADIKTMD
ncbi:MAG: TlpA disulfide reductase family protein, partial [Campylobacterota bacterium]|nr:TlpA disulfide reductase family protein [Campylobacterota bacterium]